MDEYEARGSSLITVFPAVLVASAIYASYHYFDWNRAILVAIGGSIGGLIGAKWLKKIPQFYLALSFDIFLIVVSIKTLIQG